MIQQVQKVCDACGGNGVMYRQVKVQETLDVHVPKGATDGHKISFSEKADEIPDGEAGDVVFVLQEQPHAEYKRKGDDLFLERSISLTEALCGFNMELEALDAWGGELASMLYTYRSVARALPVVSGDETRKRAMYAATFEVLDPVIARVKELISFKERAVAKWTTNLSLLIRAESRQRAAKSSASRCQRASSNWASARSM